MVKDNPVGKKEGSELVRPVRAISEAVSAAGIDPSANAGVSKTNRPLSNRRTFKTATIVLLLVPAIAGTAVWFGLPQARPQMTAMASSVGNGAETLFLKLKSFVLSKASANASVFPVRGVRVMRVSISPLVEERSFTGVVAARYEAPLSFRVGGKIAARLVEVGATVVAGTPLFKLDTADYDIALRAANANLAAAKAQQLQANAEEKRQAVLLKQGWTTQAAYDRILAGSSAANDQVDAASEDVKRTQNQLNYTTLNAPEDGIVTALVAEAGQVIGQGQPVLTMAQKGEREAIISIPEGQIANLEDWAARASLWGTDLSSANNDDSTTAITARLREVSPQADPASRTFQARYSLGTSGTIPAFGATVTIGLKRSSSEPVAVIPASAVTFNDSKPVVWVMNNSKDRAEPKEVKLVTLGSTTAQIAGLESGDMIVTLGVHRLDASLPIRVLEEISVLANGTDKAL